MNIYLISAAFLCATTTSAQTLDTNGITTAFPSIPGGVSTCDHPVERKEWRRLTIQEREEYLAAVKCLMTLPSKTKDTYTGPGKPVNRFDDFAATHVMANEQIHGNAPFFPWHRYFLHLYETALITECGYTGSHPWWDYTLDAVDEETFRNSPVFDGTAAGFGGDGEFVDRMNPNTLWKFNHTGGGCVKDGAFKDMTVNVASANTNLTCLTRDFVPEIAVLSLSKAKYDNIISQTSYNDINKLSNDLNMVSPFKDQSPHMGGHLAIGGNIGQFAELSSGGGASDPLFHLFHGSIDRLWAEWQAADEATRLHEYIGPKNFQGVPLGSQPGIPSYKNDTLDFFGLAPSIQIGSVLNTQANGFCYKYV